MKEITQLVGAVVVFVAILIGIALLLAWPVQVLWNDLMPELFAVKTISFWQALKLSFLCNCLFKSSGQSASKKE